MRLERLGNVVVSSVASQHKAGSPLLSMCLQVYFRYSGCLPESEYMKRWFEQVIQNAEMLLWGPMLKSIPPPHSTVLSKMKAKYATRKVKQKTTNK